MHKISFFVLRIYQTSTAFCDFLSNAVDLVLSSDFLSIYLNERFDQL